MKRSGFTFVEAAVIVGLLLLLAAILFPVFDRARQDKNGNCQSNLKQISLGIRQYVFDYNEKYPLLNVSRAGYWSGSLQPYLKSWRVFDCPSSETFEPAKTDYYYNARLAGKSEATIEFITRSVMLGEGVTGSPPNYSLRNFPRGRRDDQNSPARRHLEGSNYAFADAHIKWLQPKKIHSISPQQSEYTFAIE